MGGIVGPVIDSLVEIVLVLLRWEAVFVHVGCWDGDDGRFTGVSTVPVLRRDGVG